MIITVLIFNICNPPSLVFHDWLKSAEWILIHLHAAQGNMQFCLVMRCMTVFKHVNEAVYTQVHIPSLYSTSYSLKSDEIVKPNDVAAPQLEFLQPYYSV